MTQAIKKKLRSNEGASLMVALLFFVMCATVGSIILAAATASSGRLKNISQDDKAFYATTSAAEVIQDLMLKQSVAVESEKTETGPDSLDRTGAVVKKINGSDPSEATTVIEELVKERMVNSASTIKKTVNLKVTGNPELDTEANFSIDKDFNISVVLSSSDSSGDSKLTLLFPVAIQEEHFITEHDHKDGENRETTRSFLTKFYWNQVKIEKGAGA